MLRQIDLVAVWRRVELRDGLALANLIVLVDQKPDDAAGDDLRGDVDDVGLHERVVGDGMCDAEINPAYRSRETDRDQRGEKCKCESAGGDEAKSFDLQVEPEVPAAWTLLRGSHALAATRLHSWVPFLLPEPSLQ